MVTSTCKGRWEHEQFLLLVSIGQAGKGVGVGSEYRAIISGRVVLSLESTVPILILFLFLYNAQLSLILKQGWTVKKNYELETSKALFARLS